jgi:hypothetical protein
MKEKILNTLKWWFKIGWKERRDLRYDRVVRSKDSIGVVFVSTYENIKTKELKKSVSLPVA